MNPPPRINGVRFDTTNFEFDCEHRPITKNELYGIALACSMCTFGSGYSIILTRGEGIIAKALDQESFEDALAELKIQCKKLFRRNERFKSHIIAVLTFAPDHVQANVLTGFGVDAIFSPAHHGK